MKSKLNIVIRDSNQPCNPYSSSGHTFYVAIFNCDLTPFTVVPLTDPGPGGGNIYGEVELPAGSYVVVGLATCKNVLTNWAFVVAGCGETVCVNLLPRKFEQCVDELSTAIDVALAFAGFSFSSPEKEVKELAEPLKTAREALAKLSKHLPDYRLPISRDDLRRVKVPDEIIRILEQR